MAKIRVEICMISARGLRRSSSLWKPQWFAVGWIDPNNKYCTRVESSGNSNPTWKTKFSVPIDDTNSNLQGLSLTIEVYSRDPIFLREKLQGTATVHLKEFLVKFGKDTDGSRSGVEETGSFQLRKRNSGKPHGLIDISVRVLEEREGVTSPSGIHEGFKYSDHQDGITLAIEDGPELAYPTQPPVGRFEPYTPASYPHSHPMPMPPNYSNPPASGTGYRPPRTPPPPPPPINAGFLPSFFPGTGRLPENYVNLPPTGPTGQNSGPGFGMGLGAGALAAGAVIFGDDFMSGSNFPAGFEGGSLTLSTDPPF